MARRGKKNGGTTTNGERLKPLLIAAAVLGAIAFAVQGGEYGTTDLLHQKKRRASLVGAIDSLQHVVDSLQRYKHRLQTDPVLQERIAREEFGMVRGNKEMLYRFADPTADSTRAP